MQLISNDANYDDFYYIKYIITGNSNADDTLFNLFIRVGIKNNLL